MSNPEHDQTQANHERTDCRDTRSEQSGITVTQSIAQGSLSGAAEVMINHPLWSIKTIMQSLPEGERFSFQKHGGFNLYRGIMPNVVSMAPITAMQVGLNRAAQMFLFSDQAQLSNYQRIMSAFVAGAGSAFLSCPTEMIMSHQSKANPSFYGAAKYITSQRNWRALFTALPATAMRESLFTTFFLAATPMFKTHIQAWCPNDLTAAFTAGVGAGICATFFTQGVDTLKTIQQKANVAHPPGLFDAAKKLYSSQGMHGFFKGGLPRGVRVASAVAIMGCMNDKIESFFQQRNAMEIIR